MLLYTCTYRTTVSGMQAPTRTHTQTYMYVLLEVASKASSTFHTYVRAPKICGRLANREKNR